MAALEAFVYKGAVKPKKTSFGEWIEPINLHKIDILIPDRGKFRFDLQKECVSGYKTLWNASAYRRGSIVIILP